LCGIFGFITYKPSEENLNLFKDLCYLSSVRGTDSTGIAVVVDDKVIIEKDHIEASEFLKKKMPKYEKRITKANIAIGHTRKWTQGKPEDNNNNHPIFSNNWVMVHNGVCSSMDRIKDYKYHGEVDSEILLSYVEKQGLEKGLANLQGYAAVALLNTKDPESIYLWRHNESLYLGYDRATETLVFGSTEDILEVGLANEMLLFSSFQIRKLPEDTLYRITCDPHSKRGKVHLEIKELAEVEIKKPVYNWKSNWNKGPSTTYTSRDRSIENVTWEWNPELGCCVPIYEEDTIEAEVATGLPTNRYYFPKQSVDFANWNRVGKSFVSSDGTLVKAWDKDKRVHFIMSFDDALTEGVITPGEI
jgi:glucosamine 6-phosphate synthetase-like amidotransferase/phosphosugar isomerase protein